MRNILLIGWIVVGPFSEEVGAEQNECDADTIDLAVPVTHPLAGRTDTIELTECADQPWITWTPARSVTTGSPKPCTPWSPPASA